MIRTIFTGIALLVSTFIFAQQSTSSPYSYFGIGETTFRGTPEQQAMGGLGILPDSIHINLLNPASYSSLKLTVITIAGGTNFNTLSTDQTSEKAKRTSLDYLTFGIPMGKFGVAFGLNAQTAVGYRIQTVAEDLSNMEQFLGEGGTNRVFAGAAYQVTPKLSVGADLSYHFGQMENTSKYFQNGVHFGTRIRQETTLNGFTANLGVMYKSKFQEKYDLYLSSTFNPFYQLDYKTTGNIASIYQTNSGAEVVDTSQLLAERQSSFSLPSKVSVGAGIGLARKWFVGTEAVFSGKNEYTDGSAMRLSLGGYYIPKYNSFTNYFSRITYRAGLRYENTGIVVNDQTINDMGVNFGLSFPVGNGFSDIALGMEYGIRGTKNAGLVQENYFNINIGISFGDKWFRKVLFD
ncbi:MAG: hypothetical protein WCY89_11990 [Flavobacteriaceae bacterium]